MKRYPFLILTLFILSSIALAQQGNNPRSDTLLSPGDDLESQKRAVIIEIKRRRESREALKKKIDHKSAAYDLTENGAVYQPWSQENDDPEDWIIRNGPVAHAAAAYSAMIEKEVMVSSKVANRMINLNAIHATRHEAAKEFEDALKQIQVDVVTLSDEISVLVDNPPEENQDL